MIAVNLRRLRSCGRDLADRSRQAHSDYVQPPPSFRLAYPGKCMELFSFQSVDYELACLAPY